MKCFICNAEAYSQLFGIPICTLCASELRLFTDDTIRRQVANYKASERYASYRDEISDRLAFVEKDYLKKNIKLLHVLDRLDYLKE